MPSVLPLFGRYISVSDLYKLDHLHAFEKKNMDLLLQHSVSKAGLMLYLSTRSPLPSMDNSTYTRIQEFFRSQVTDDECAHFLSKDFFAQASFIGEENYASCGRWLVTELVARDRQDLLLESLQKKEKIAVMGAAAATLRHVRISREIEVLTKRYFAEGFFTELCGPHSYLLFLDYAQERLAEDSGLFLCCLEFIWPVLPRIHRSSWTGSDRDERDARMVAEHYAKRLGHTSEAADFLTILQQSKHAAEIFYCFAQIVDAGILISEADFLQVMRALRGLSGAYQVLLPYTVQFKKELSPFILKILSDGTESRDARILSGFLAYKLELEFDQDLVPPLFRQLPIPDQVRSELLLECLDYILDEPHDKLYMLDMDWYVEALWLRKNRSEIPTRCDAHFLRELDALGIPRPDRNDIGVCGNCFFYDENKVDPRTLELIDQVAAKHGALRLSRDLDDLRLTGLVVIKSIDGFTVESPTLGVCLCSYW